MAKSAKRQAPSRIRYEQGHPTVSCRVPKKLYDRLRAAKEAEGRSFADILKMGLGIIEVRIKGEAEARREGHAKGYKKGYADAEHLYEVTYFCNVCGQTMRVTTPEEKEAIKSYMRQHGWGHKECHEKRR